MDTIYELPRREVTTEALQRPLLAESGPSKSSNFAHPNVRYWEKRTFAITTQVIEIRRSKLSI